MATASEHDVMAEETLIDPTTLYRRNLKANNRKKYNQYLDKQKERSKDYRQRIKNDPEKMIKLREKAKLRQKNLRERRKEAAKTQEQTTSSVLKEKSKPRTRAESESLRKQWRDSKIKYRKNMSSHKKVWVRKKDRERKQDKARPNSSQIAPQPESGFRSKKTLYNVTSKARKVLPLSPDKFASVMKNLVQNSTPRKRQATEDLMEISPKVRKCDETKEHSEKVKGTCIQNQQVASSSQQESPVEIEVQQKENSKTTRVESKHSQGVKYPKWYRVSPWTVHLARNFYFRSDISTTLPQK